MKIHVQNATLTDIKADWLLVGIWEGETGPHVSLDEKLGGILGRLLEKGEFGGKLKELVPILEPRGLSVPRLLLFGLGKRPQADAHQLCAAAAVATKSLTGRQWQRLALALPDIHSGLDADLAVRALLAGMCQASEGPGIRKNKPDRFPPEEIILVVPPSVPAGPLQQTVARADSEARGVGLARELVNMPPCDLYPESFAQRAVEAARRVGLECEVFDENRLAQEQMGSLLAVGRGSERPSRVVVLKHRQGGAGKTLAMVGKGVTFDSGGLSLKTTEQMVDMKCDMAGAAAVLGAMQAIAEQKVPVNVLGVLALVENMVSGKAMKLGDVLRARNGKTIEVLNTDAEGRLILADALAYAVDQGAGHIVDLATLTGACMVALGTEVAGLMGNQTDWSLRVQRAAQNAGELAWPLPMYPFYSDMIKSDVADIKNTGGSRYAGAISAAKFLEEFVGQVPWVHLDIAGPAWAEKESAVRTSGGTGCFVRTLVELARTYV